MLFFNNIKIPSTYYLIDNYKKMSWLYKELMSSDEFAVDCETNHVTIDNKDKKREYHKYHLPHIVGISFAWGRSHVQDPWKPGLSAYIPILDSDDKEVWGKSQTKIIDLLREILERKDVTQVYHNGKFDIKWFFKNFDIRVDCNLFDTMLCGGILDEEGFKCSHGLKSKYNQDKSLKKLGMTDYYLDIDGSVFKRDLDEALLHYDPEFRRFNRIPLDILWPYGAGDTDLTLSLKHRIDPLLDQEGLRWVFENITMPLSSSILKMEIHGAPFDLEKAREVSESQTKIIRELTPVVYQKFGREFNIASEELGRILFEELGYEGEKTKDGKWLVDEKTLRKLDHPAIDEIIRIRKASKLVSTYIDSTLNCVEEVTNCGRTGWVHPDVFLISRTGRLRTSNPNLTNQPKPDPEEEAKTKEPSSGRLIRSCYQAEEGYKMVFCDFSQAELRAMAHVSNDPVWVSGFKNKVDMHCQMAFSIAEKKGNPLNCDVNDVKDLYPKQRKDAKTINFGIAFGQSAYGLASGLGVSIEESESIIDDYYSAAPVLKQSIDSTHEFAKKYGYVNNIFGRRRHLPDAMLPSLKSERWPDRNERPSCYRWCVPPYKIGVDQKDIYSIKESDIKSKINVQNLGSYKKCLGCKHIKSCFINSEVSYVERAKARALRQSYNSIIQGSIADMTSLSHIWVTDELKRARLDASVFLYVHDELGVYSKNEHVGAVKQVFHDCLVTRLTELTQFRVPLVIDIEVKDHWGE